MKTRGACERSQPTLAGKAKTAGISLFLALLIFIFGSVDILTGERSQKYRKF